MNFMNLDIKSRIFDPERLPALDYWRAMAILFVIFWHFIPVEVPFGGIGVQIFFVLSGFLVSRPLVRALLKRESIPWGRFFQARVFRILPSYYAFLALGSLFGWVFLSSDQGILISEEYLLSFVLFYKNYNSSNPLGFAHMWSLCVEEHCYLFLPLLFVMLAKVKRNSVAVGTLVFMLVLAIIIRWIGYTGFFEQRGIFFSNPASTQNIYDSLVFGVLVRFAYEMKFVLKTGLTQILTFIFGLIILSISIYSSLGERSLFYYTVMWKTFNALGIALMIWSSLYYSSRFLQILRYLSFYSYNWYLWHMMGLLFVHKYLGEKPIFFIPFVAFSFLLAVLSTHLIELNAYKLKELFTKPAGKTTNNL